MKRLFSKFTRILLFIVMLSMLAVIATASTSDEVRWDHNASFAFPTPKNPTYYGDYNATMRLSKTFAFVSLDVSNLGGTIPLGEGVNISGSAVLQDGDTLNLSCSSAVSVSRSRVPENGDYFVKTTVCSFSYNTDLIITHSLELQ